MQLECRVCGGAVSPPAGSGQSPGEGPGGGPLEDF